MFDIEELVAQELAYDAEYNSDATLGDDWQPHRAPIVCPEYSADE